LLLAPVRFAIKAIPTPLGIGGTVDAMPSLSAHPGAVFWGEISPCDHFVQMYEKDSVFLDTLEGFVSGGLMGEDSAVIIATPDHLAALAARLRDRGIDLEAAMASDRYIPLDAEVTLAKFMVDHWPDDARFHATVGDILVRAQKSGRQVRAFGEMVALLWARGDSAATVRLEHLWHHLCHAQSFSLFCAYPKAGFTKDAAASIQEICDAHSRVLDV
jgi:hypothetical protein